MEERNPRIGDVYEMVDKGRWDQGGCYILSQISYGQICLISLIDGNRLTEPVEVEDIDSISEREWDAIVSEHRFRRPTGIDLIVWGGRLKVQFRTKRSYRNKRDKS